MSPISKSHKLLSKYLNPRVLEYPEEFLGPNFEAVLNFWLIFDDLSKEQWRVVEELYDDFYDEKYSEWLKAKELAIDASREVVGWRYADDAGYAAEVVTESEAAYDATIELIGMHEILEDHQQPLIIFPMFLKVL